VEGTPQARVVYGDTRPADAESRKRLKENYTNRKKPPTSIEKTPPEKKKKN